VKLSDLLSRLPIDHLVRIAMNCGIVCGTHSKRQLIQAIQGNFRRREFLRHVMDRWNEQERATLAYLLLSPQLFLEAGEKPSILFLPQQLRRSDEHDRRLRLHFETLRAHGFLLPENGRDREDSVWTVPDDLRKDFERLLLQHPSGAPAPAPQGEPKKTLHAGQSLLEDLFTLLIFARKERLRLTREGTIFKRSWEQLQQYFLVPKEENLEPLPPNCPDRLKFMLDFAKRYQILMESDRELLATRNLENWMLKEDLDKHTDLFQYLRRVLVADDPGCARILRFLAKQDSRAGWTSIEEPIRACYGHFPGRPWWMPQLKARVYWLFQTLMNLGFVDLGRFSEGRIAYRWLPLGDSIIRNKRGKPPRADTAAQITLQPDFEVFVSRNIALNVRWQLERLADLTSRDVVFCYRISRESFYRGLKWGVTLEETVEFLKQGSGRNLPQNVLHNLENWAGQYGNISFADVMLVRCQTEQIAREIQIVPELAPLIRGQIGTRDLIISRKDYNHVLGLLERNGYLPKPGIVTYEDEGGQEKTSPITRKSKRRSRVPRQEASEV